MSATLIAVALRPIASLLFMAVIVIPIELALRRAWPKGRLKNLLFGRNFDKRHPRLWIGLVLGSYVAAGLLLWAWLEFRHHLIT